MMEPSSAEILQAVTERWTLNSPALVAVFRSSRYSNDERNAIRIEAHHISGHYRLLSFALSEGGADLSGRRRDALLQFASRILRSITTPDAAAEVFPDIDWNVVASTHQKIDQIENPVRRFALKYSFPDSFAEALLKEYGDEAAALAAALNAVPPCTIRANTLRTSRDKLAAALIKDKLRVSPTEFFPHALNVDNAGGLFKTKAFQSGEFEMQDEGSQLIAALVQPARGSQVLDMCAGFGGKTLALSALMEGTGTLIALDTSEFKLTELRRRARRAGAHNIRALCTAADSAPAEIADKKGAFDRVLVDAPCGGSGALRRNPEARWRDNANRLAELPRLQESLVLRAFEFCAVGGRVIYSTCSIFNAENESVVEKVVAKTGCGIVPLKLIFGKSLAARVESPCGRFMKLLPHKHGTDGFFAAVLRRTP